MTTITKERIELFIKNPLDNGLTRGEQMELARIALASLEAEPVGAFHIAEQQVDGTSDYLKDGEWPIDNGIIEVYAAPPVPVVPAALPENDDEDGHDIDYLEPSEVYALGRTAGWNACRAAMLHGKSEQPQNAQQNIPENIPGGNSPVTPDGWVMVPKELTPEMMRAVQIRSELGGYATSNLSGAYNMFSEFWNVAVSAAPKVDDL
ncbi:Eaa protein [Escherichia coli]|nr:Eaa protein [Escherichia coli]